MPGDSPTTGSGHPPGKRMADQKRELRHTPEASGRRSGSWEATLWGRHIRCHELDQHVYLDGRFLDLTPIEFGLFWLLLRQALQVNIGASHHHPPHQVLSWDERISLTMPERYLQGLGIVPILELVWAMSADLRSVISRWPAATQSGSTAVTAIARLDEEEKEDRIEARSRASLSSHLDRLRSKLRCHGLDIGTVLLFGRSARGYLLCPLGDGTVPGGSAR